MLLYRSTLLFSFARSLLCGDLGGNGLYVIFKDGDDLRQDLLTLQLFNITDVCLHTRSSSRTAHAVSCTQLSTVGVCRWYGGCLAWT